MAFNCAHVVNGQRSCSSYGSLDTFIQWLGLVEYDYLDPVGPTTAHIRYSNIVPLSWDDPYIAFKPEGVGYPGFRGSDDRHPIFVSRQIHLVLTYVLLLAIAYLTIWVYGSQALLVLAPLILLSVAPEQYSQTALSLPNALNAMLTFGAVTFAMVFCDRWERRWLLASAVCLALGFNFKIDIVLMLLAPALALAVAWFRRGFRFAFVSAAEAAVLFVAVFIATNPGSLIAPIQEVRGSYHFLWEYDSPGASTVNVLPNLLRLSQFITSSLFWAGAPPLAGPATLGVGAAAVLCLTRVPKKRAWPIVAIGVCVALVAWAAVVVKGPAPDRYFLNGYAACMAAIGMGLVLHWRTEGRRPRQVAYVIVALIGVSYLSHAALQSWSSSAVYASTKAFGGFDPAHHRNQAENEAVKLIRQGNYMPLVLVDQHSYTDLRPLRVRGVDARYINMVNSDKVIDELRASGRYLIIFSRGTYDKRFGIYQEWMGDWSSELRSQYDAYKTKLTTLPVIHHFRGKPQLVISSAPIDPDDDMYLSVLTVP
jgi:hypothetical protein